MITVRHEYIVRKEIKIAGTEFYHILFKFQYTVWLIQMKQYKYLVEKCFKVSLRIMKKIKSWFSFYLRKNVENNEEDFKRGLFQFQNNFFMIHAFNHS